MNDNVMENDWKTASKKPTTPGIPKRSPIQVLTGPYAA